MCGMCRNVPEWWVGLLVASSSSRGRRGAQKRPFRSHPPSVLLLLRRMSEILEGEK